MSNKNIQTQNIMNPATFTTFYATFQITGLLIICLVYNWIVSFRGGFSFTEAKIIFNWHPLLMTIGFTYLMANSILHYRSFRNTTKTKLKQQHAIIHGLVLVCILLAACAALVSHLYASPPIPNFYSLHSWIGIVTVVLFISQFLTGILCFLYPEMRSQCKETILPYHTFFGITIFVLAIATSILGFSEKLIFALDKQYKLFPAEALYGNFLGVLCLFYGVLVVYMAIKPEFKRSPKLEYEPLL